MRHQALEDQLFADGELPEIFAQRRCIVEPAHAVPADVGLGDQRKRQPSGPQRLPGTFEVDVKRAKARAAPHDHEIRDPSALRRGNVTQIVAFGIAPHPPVGWLGLAAVGKVTSGDAGRNRSSSRREAGRTGPPGCAPPTSLAGGTGERSHAAIAVGAGRVGRLTGRLLEAEDLSTEKSDCHQNAEQEGHVHSPARSSSASPKKTTMQSMSGR